VNRAILERLDFAPSHRVLDVGCGDASLMRRVLPVARAVGTVLTEAERARLAAAGYSIEFYRASFDEIPTIEGEFDRIVANSCLMFARTDAGGRSAVSNLAAKLAPRGKLWLGELLEKRCDRHVYRSSMQAIKLVRRRLGCWGAARFARHIIRRRSRADAFVELGCRLWHTTPEKIAALAADLGLGVDGWWRCEEMTGDPLYALQNRFSVLLVKPS